MNAALPRIMFDVQVPVDAAGLRSNIAAACALGLPELPDFAYPYKDPLTIVGNGPSALNAPARHPVMAVNAAIKTRPHAPNYWIGCDPQELLVDMLPDNPPHGTTYFVASKCHPAVFKRLRAHNVIIWHVDESATRDLLFDRLRIGAGVSVTLCAFELGAQLGYRRFETWGWDGCILDGAENAIPQFNGHEAKKVELQREDGTTTFDSTTTWAAEMQDAYLRFMGFPFPIHIHGPGMFAAVLHQLLPNRVSIDEEVARVDD